MSVMTDLSNGHGGRWLPLAEATIALGCSERTIRRALAAGRYQKRRVHGRLHVLVTPTDVADSAAAALSDVAAATDHAGVSRVGVAPLADTPDKGETPAVAQALELLERVLAEERTRAERERERASVAEQAAAMWQERARNLETELERMLALPAHEELAAPRRWWRWWRWWRG